MTNSDGMQTQSDFHYYNGIDFLEIQGLNKKI